MIHKHVSHLHDVRCAVVDEALLAPVLVAVRTVKSAAADGPLVHQDERPTERLPAGSGERTDSKTTVTTVTRLIRLCRPFHEANPPRPPQLSIEISDSSTKENKGRR